MYDYDGTERLFTLFYGSVYLMSPANWIGAMALIVMLTQLYAVLDQ